MSLDWIALAKADSRFQEQRALSESMTDAERAFMNIVLDVEPGGSVRLLGDKGERILLALRAYVATPSAPAF